MNGYERMIEEQQRVIDYLTTNQGVLMFYSKVLVLRIVIFAYSCSFGSNWLLIYLFLLPLHEFIAFA